jgi:hypothetical protein
MTVNLSEEVVVWIVMQRRDGPNRSKPSIGDHLIAVTVSFLILWCQQTTVIRSEEMTLEERNVIEEAMLS